MKAQLTAFFIAGLLAINGCTLQVQPPSEQNTTSVTAPAEAPVADATNGLGDPYFPLEGNPGYDVQHYTIELTVESSDLQTIAGTTTIEALATADLPTFNLDFLGLEISALTVDGVAAAYNRDGQELTVTPATPIAFDATFEVAVTYAGAPGSYHDPALQLLAPPLLDHPLLTGWNEWDKGYVSGMSQPDGAMTWFPANNHPADKATYTFRITVDDPDLAIASGTLQEVIPVDDDTNTYVWEMNDPMATQVTTVVVGEFELSESEAPNGVPIRNYFPVGLDLTMIDAFDQTGEMLVYLADLFGDYPYDAYGVVIIPGWIKSSGLETQSLSTLSADFTSQDTIIHELGHQWFGNSITVKAWPDLWLHEGFARYIEALWAEKTEGVDAYDAIIVNQVEQQLAFGSMLPPMLGHPPLEAGHVFPAVDPGLKYNYFSSYSAGALLLHALRLEVGDETFFKILPTFYQRFKDIPVTTADFVAVAEEIAGRDLSEVWETWLYGTAMPHEIALLSGKTATFGEPASPAEGATPEAESAPDTATFGDAWESTACATFGIADTLAAQADCGYVTVQENRATNSASTIRLAVVRVRSTSDTPGTPLFKGTGGPGGAGFGRALPDFAQSNANILEDRDYIFFSQRGTKYAEPYLFCDAYDTVPMNAAINGWTDEESLAQKREGLQSCLDDFVAQGVDFAAYNSNENADDVNDIRQTLGYDKIIYLGESYGTMLGQFLMRNHPDILEAVILDGIVPVKFTHWSDVSNMEAAFERVFDACAADEACHAAYPFPESALAEAFAALEANPQTIELTLQGKPIALPIDGLMMMNGVFLKLYTAGGYAEVPALAYQLQANDLSSLYSALPLYLASGGPARLMHFAIVCSDDPVGSLDDLNVEDMADMYVALAADDAQNYILACPILNVEQLPRVSDEPVASDLPVLLLNGGLDPATQAEPARSLQETMPNSQYVVVPAGAHIQHNSPCGQSILDAFMSDPFAPVNQSCISPEIPFALPQRVSVSSEDGSATFSIELPLANPIGPGLWAINSGTINLSVYPAGTTAEEAIAAYIKTLPIPVDMEFVEVDPIAGDSTTMMSADSSFQGSRVGLDSFAMTDETGTYVINFITQTAPLIDTFRQDNIPALLATVQIGE